MSPNPLRPNDEAKSGARGDIAGNVHLVDKGREFGAVREYKSDDVNSALLESLRLCHKAAADLYEN
jgi:hypothetical protein